MATICKVQCFLPCYSHIPLSSQTQRYWLSKSSFEHSQRKNFRSCVCSVKKSRNNRKVKSDVELCDEIREFVLTVGLPEGHVPSFKELSSHGRTDLANIVRRRGYKVIRDLLSSSTDVDVPIEKEQQTIIPVGQCQDEKETEVPIGTSLSTEVPIIIAGDEEAREGKEADVLENTEVSMAKVHVDSEDADLEHESGDDERKDDNADAVLVDISLLTDVPLTEEEDVSYEENGQETKPLVEGSTFSTNTTSGHIEQQDEEVKDDDASNESKSEEINGSNESENMVGLRATTPNEEEHGHVASGSSATVTLNGNFSMSSQAKAVDDPYGNDYLPTDYLSRTTLDNDLDATTHQTEIQVEINRLKVMLHRKELELSQLKDQVEREKRALFELQKKAEDDINKFQRLITEKTAELQAAEKRLSRLVEVMVQYSGECEIVEVAGSFNGWHHRIKLDPEPSSSIRDSTISRKPRLWSTNLWLYPGVYEIKFIVDGHWTLDPQKETVQKRGITNNILRVV